MTMAERYRKSALYRKGRLTDLEKDTIRLVAEGLTNPEIAERQTESMDTVKSRLQQIAAILEARGRASIVDKAYKRNILGPPDANEMAATIERLRGRVDTLRRKVNLRDQEVKELTEQLGKANTEIERLRKLNNDLGNQAVEWLSDRQGRP